MTLFQRFMVATIVVACIFLTPLASHGQTSITPQEATVVASNWFHLGQDMAWGWAGTTAPVPSSSKPLFEAGELVGYCLTAPSGGYVIVPAYRELPPITVYSTESIFDPTAEDGFSAMIRQQLAAKLAVVRTVINTPSPSADQQPMRDQIAQDLAQWQAYTSSYDVFTQAVATANQQLDASAPRRPGRYSVDDINPLLTTNWHQNGPYNGMCPMGDGGRCAVGCVATACSQILNYWRYTATTGSHSYTWNGDQSCGHSVGGSPLSVTYSDGYDWVDMQNNYSGTEPQIQKDAVAELCYEVAVALNMDFGFCGSGANTAYVATILPAYFGFASDINVQYRTNYATAAAWFAMLQTDLNAGRPLQYRIASHSIVCDGWRISGGNQVHMNYGWADGHTAWYTVDALYCAWSGCSPTVEYAIRSIHPAGTVQSSLTLTHPNGGELLEVGDTHNIQWSSQNVSGNVQIEINRNYPNGTWETLSSGTPNTGAFPWIVTAPASETVRARVSSVANPAVADVSDGNFTTAAVLQPQVVISQESDGMRLAWDNVFAPYYRIYSADSLSGAYTLLLGSTSDTTYLDATPLQDTKFYRVTSSTTP